MKRIRFSLRGLLLITVAVAILCWYRDLPRQNAERFVALVEAGDFPGAEALIGEPIGLARNEAGVDRWRAFSRQRSAMDWLCGRCYVSVTGDLDRFRFATPVVATAHGVRPMYSGYTPPIPLDEGTAKLSRREAIAIAHARAGANRRFFKGSVSFNQYHDGVRKWTIYYDRGRHPGDHFFIWVNDADGSTDVVGGA